MVSIIFDLLTSEKSSTVLKAKKKIHQNSLQKVSKEAEFSSDFINVQKS
jgi:hypothetical protein